MLQLTCYVPPLASGRVGHAPNRQKRVSLLTLHKLVGGASDVSGGDFLEVPGGRLSHSWEEGVQPSRSCDKTAQALGCLCDAVF